MKNLELKQILENALEGKNGFNKIINMRDEKIAKMIYSSLENIDAYYDKKFNIKETNEKLTKEVVDYYYGKNSKVLTDSKETRTKKHKDFSKRIYKNFSSEQAVPSHLITMLENSAKRYLSVETKKTLLNKTYTVSFERMPEAKVEKLEKINAFFEKHFIRDEKEVEENINTL